MTRGQHYGDAFVKIKGAVTVMVNSLQEVYLEHDFAKHASKLDQQVRRVASHMKPTLCRGCGVLYAIRFFWACFPTKKKHVERHVFYALEVLRQMLRPVLVELRPIAGVCTRGND